MRDKQQHSKSVLKTCRLACAKQVLASAFKDRIPGCMQVFKARWNGVQDVAVKQLIQSTSDIAKTEFLREVTKHTKHCQIIATKDWAMHALQTRFAVSRSSSH